MQQIATIRRPKWHGLSRQVIHPFLLVPLKLSIIKNHIAAEKVFGFVISRYKRVLISEAALKLSSKQATYFFEYCFKKKRAGYIK